MRFDSEDLIDDAWATDDTIHASFEADREARRALYDPEEVLCAFEEWFQRGRPLIQKAKKIQWEIGDWLREGDSIGGEGNEFLVLPEGRDLIAEVAARTDYDEDSLRDFRRVARAFPTPETRHLVPWGHHQAVAAIEDEEKREELLVQAACHGTSLSDLRTAVRVYNGDKRSKPDDDHFSPSADHRVREVVRKTGLSMGKVLKAMTDHWFDSGAYQQWLETQAMYVRTDFEGKPVHVKNYVPKNRRRLRPGKRAPRARR